MKKIVLMSAFVFGMAGTGAAFAGDEHDFLGLWSGVDDSDGSSVLVSITDPNEDDVLDIRWSETAWDFCGGQSDALISGTGTVDDDVLTASVTLECFTFPAGPITIDPFTLTEREDGTITNDDGGNRIPLHRISDE